MNEGYIYVNRGGLIHGHLPQNLKVPPMFYLFICAAGSSSSGHGSYADANYVQPWKRPLSSMSPMMVIEDGRLRMVVGASGGSHIVTAVLQLLERILVQGEDLQTALRRPRIEEVFSPDTLHYENYSFSNMTFQVPDVLLGYLKEKV